MSKKPRFGGLFDKQHGKRSKAVLKSASQHLYPIDWSLLVNTSATDEKYPFQNRDNLTISIQMQLSQKKKQHFLNFLLHFWNLNEILNILTKKVTFIDFVISITGSENVVI